MSSHPKWVRHMKPAEREITFIKAMRAAPLVAIIRREDQIVPIPAITMREVLMSYRYGSPWERNLGTIGTLP